MKDLIVAEKTPPQPLPTRGRGLDAAPAPVPSAVFLRMVWRIAGLLVRIAGLLFQRLILLSYHLEEKAHAARKPLPLVGRGWGGVLLSPTVIQHPRGLPA